MTTNAYMAARWPATSYRLVQAVDKAAEAIQYQADQYRLGEMSRGEYGCLCACNAHLCSVLAAIDALGNVDLRAAVSALELANRSISGLAGVKGMVRVYGALRDVAIAVKAAALLPAA